MEDKYVQFIMWFVMWFAGYLISGWMIKTDHIVKGNTYTHHDNIIAGLVSLLSWCIVLFILLKTYYESIKPFMKEPIKSDKQ